MSKILFSLLLIAFLASHGGAAKAQERPARADPPSWHASTVERERERREFWQSLAFFACAGSVVFLIVGVAMGSATIRKQRGGPSVFKP
jgi:hypothetical protein